MIYDICIIGGGASGLTAGIAAARQGASVLIAERASKVAGKIFATGNGRCNLSNASIRREDLKDLVSKNIYRSDDPDFVLRVLERFDVSDTVDFFRSIGVVTHRRDELLYPCSDQAASVADALKWALAGLKNVDIRTDTQVTGITPGKLNKGIRGFRIQTLKDTYYSRKVILSAGSPAGLKPSENINIYTLASGLGHTIIPAVPALCGIRCRSGFFSDTAGVRVNGKLTLYIDGQPSASDLGEIQLTAYGVSGIPAFQISRFAAKALADNRETVIHMDLFPDHSEAEIREMILDIARSQPSYQMRMVLSGIMNRKLASALIRLCGIDAGIKAGEVTGCQMDELVRLMRDLTVKVTGVNPFEQAQSCAGGVSTREISPADLSSKVVKGLYLTGEMMDVDGICGGFNLQWAWATGYLAGTAAGRSIHDQGKSG